MSNYIHCLYWACDYSSIMESKFKSVLSASKLTDTVIKDLKPLTKGKFDYGVVRNYIPASTILNSIGCPNFVLWHALW